MADNYLEKKEEQLRSGAAIYRRTSPSVEQLLRRVADATPADPSYKVLSAQLQAICRAAAILCPEASFECTEGAPACIETVCAAPSRALLAMQLKAAELGLKSRICNSNSIEIFK